MPDYNKYKEKKIVHTFYINFQLDSYKLTLMKIVIDPMAGVRSCSTPTIRKFTK